MLRIVDITAPDINNGNGIRVTVWFAGCTHKCKGCHNSWTWNYNQGKDFISEQDEILSIISEWLNRYYVDGITLSGGDPLDQQPQALEELEKLINWVRVNYPTKTIWCYTGYVYEELNEQQKKIADKCDYLVDGPYKEELRDISNCPFRGSTNQRILDMINHKQVQ
jgi:anaerobic ribonucleoside-triphosphate reductase activating protein